MDDSGHPKSKIWRRNCQDCCKMISLDPDTGEHNPQVLRQVAQAHAAFTGVYCAVLVEGILTKGDSIELLD
jgi:uncharacterized protein